MMGASKAADAATVAQVAIGLLRQQLPSSARVAAIVTDGGQATNIIPASAVVEVEVRSFTLDGLRDVKRRVLACLEAGALASGCTWEVTASQPRYANLIQEPLLASAWDDALAELGRATIPQVGRFGGSTDMGNVSHVVSSIHPMIGLHEKEAPPHTIEFAATTRSADGDRAVLDAAVALAWTVLDAALDPAKRSELLERQARRGPGTTTAPPEDA
jgi:metal-dependent amidase/aminoacylase/carboxypeptidase family protein